MSNQATGNSVMVFDRAAGGGLTQRGTFPTGGLGSAGVTDPLDSLLSQGSLTLSEDHRFLFAVEAGSNEVSVLAVEGEKLIPIDRVPSGGTFPVSVTVHNNLLYVLHRGDATTGNSNITGFTVDAQGKLSALPGSTRALVGGPNAFPAQVRFTPDGTQLVVTERTNNLIDVLLIDDQGRAGPLVKNNSSGRGPFGFTFAGKDLLIVSELSGATSSYRLAPNGTLTVISGSVSTAEEGACWVVTNSTADPRFAYVSNAVSGSISGYRIDSAGALSLLNRSGHTAVTVSSFAAIDSAVSGDDRFLYVITGGFSETAETPIMSNAMNISAFRIEADGKLTTIPGTDPEGLPPAIQGLAPNIQGLAPGTQGIVAT
ncbi:MAG: beta-propeller fold lactonase family protein [Pseudonocardiaceae bacterium]